MAPARVKPFPGKTEKESQSIGKGNKISERDAQEKKKYHGNQQENNGLLLRRPQGRHNKGKYLVKSKGQRYYGTGDKRQPDLGH